MKKIFASQVQERDWIETPFLVRDKTVGMAKNGKPYLSLKLMDRTGEIEGRVWDRVDELSTSTAGQLPDDVEHAPREFDGVIPGADPESRVQ